MLNDIAHLQQRCVPTNCLNLRYNNAAGKLEYLLKWVIIPATRTTIYEKSRRTAIVINLNPLIINLLDGPGAGEGGPLLIPNQAIVKLENPGELASGTPGFVPFTPLDMELAKSYQLFHDRNNRHDYTIYVLDDPMTQQQQQQQSTPTIIQLQQQQQFDLHQIKL
ncbi:hypothetical protein DAPPUDRAFT_116232 [Daphnia pulex]|uniref:Uncharacterized protein n=1 Tax=Daphnia pulex TaxID=6669 RepID=E9HNZ2_DAPPU|nr:hypothetical protein DAPPUDRAFT_116232 [Daphnia pulex]|eukprot:EFX66550.1 hypothetical protein DAPPUDRAFT_116232 [Daphnia pulex]